MIKLKDLAFDQPYITHQGLSVVTLGDFLAGDKIIDDKVYLPSIGINLQRDYCWSIQQKRDFVLAFIRRIKMPPFAFVVNDKRNSNEIFQVIDGKQRLDALLSFAKNEFCLENGIFFDDIIDKKNLLCGIGRYSIVCDVAYGDISDLEKIDWFRNINFKGSQQDICHNERIARALADKRGHN
jgi:hypothetical protein